MGLTALAGASVAGGLTNALIGSNAAKSAAQSQVTAANAGNQTLLNMFNKTQNNLQPYMGVGSTGIGMLGNALSSAPMTTPLPTYQSYGDYQPVANFTPTPSYQPTAPFQAVTAANLDQTPGYQFTLNQGLKGVTNQFSAAGLTGSGAQGKGLADYATGLASNTYNQQVANAQSNFNTGLQGNIENFNTGQQGAINNFNTLLQGNLSQYQTGLAGHQSDFNTGFNSLDTSKTDTLNRLLSLISVGGNAAAGLGQIGGTTASGMSANTIGAGQASAAGTVGSANALAGGLTSAMSGGAQGYLTNQLLQSMGINLGG